MAFTRYHDDTARIQKQLQISTNAGIYQLTAPGQGLDLPYMEDPQIRLQKWGANFDNNIITMESDLRGLTRKYNKDLPDINDHNKHEAAPNAPYFKTQQPLVEESRVTHPAWMYKDLEQTRWETPLLNPLNGLEKTFENNIPSRLVEKDNFRSTYG